MLYPALGSLLDKSKTRYGLVVAVAKRARELSDMDTIQHSPVKTVSMAIKEIADGDVTINLE